MRSTAALLTLALAGVLTLSSAGQASAAGATRIGPVAKVKGDMDGIFTVKTSVYSTDKVKVCIKGDGLLPDAVAKVKFNGTTHKVRRSVYEGAGCSKQGFSIAAGTTITYQACFADPRDPNNLLCGKRKTATAV